ncbi:MAG TPA: methionine--tRNA ligase subunit beta [Candidatus Sumerlaeota bacterium]|nr:methionine--tRNA ligase subunit beta [Candidatus Sumerlaeota bacterium]
MSSSEPSSGLARSAGILAAGNLASRVVAMIQKFCGGVIPESETLQAEDIAVQKALDDVKASINELLDELKFNELLEKIMTVCRSVNKYINDMAPWDLAAKKNTSRLKTVLNMAAKTACGCAQLLLPVMPVKAAEALQAFGITNIKDDTIESGFAAGNKTASAVNLFPRAVIEKKEAPAPKPSAPEQESSYIEYDDFAKIQLKVAKVLNAERVSNADKLLRIDIEVGSERRQIVAGIAKDYQPEEIIGKSIIIVANLRPRKLRGLESNGMLLAAHGEKGLALVTVDRPIESGGSVS